jgi:hypothetical protein
MIYTEYRNPLYDGTTAATNPAPPPEINPSIIPAAHGLTKLTVPAGGNAGAFSYTSESEGDSRISRDGGYDALHYAFLAAANASP